jgi:hypothetical protein
LFVASAGGVEADGGTDREDAPTGGQRHIPAQCCHVRIALVINRTFVHHDNLARE